MYCDISKGGLGDFLVFHEKKIVISSIKSLEERFSKKSKMKKNF